MKQYVTLPGPTGGVWASGPSFGVDHVLPEGLYMVAPDVDLAEARLPGFCHVIDPITGHAVAVAESAVA